MKIKMNKGLTIIGFLLLSLLFSARSCDEGPGADDRRDEALVGSVKDSMRMEMEAPGLSEEDLKAREGVALQKVSEYRDYTKIVMDTSLDLPFRQKAREMAGSLFLPGCLPREGTVIDSARIRVPFHPVNDSAYAATLLLFPTSSPSGTRTLEVFIVKRNKVFGADTLKTWEVLLGDMH
jgi:hypothetical protein